MDKAFDTVFEACERAETGDLGDGAVHDLPKLVLVGDRIPGFRLGTLEREGDLALIGVDRQDIDVYAVARLEKLAGVGDALPRKLTQVDEAIGSANIDERTEVANRGDSTRPYLARLKLLEQAGAHAFALL